MIESSLARDHKLGMGGIDGNVNVSRTLSRPVMQNQAMQLDMYCDSDVDRQFVGVVGAENESSLFSSSLSDLVDHKLWLSGKNFLSQSSTGASQNDNEAESFKPYEETEGQTINNLLPDEEELFSGMVDEMGHVGPNNSADDLEDFDVFTYSGGIELESDDHPSRARQTNIGYPWGVHQKQHPIPSVDKASSVLSPSLSNGVINENSHFYNGFQSPVRNPSIGNGFGLNDSARSFPQVRLNNRGIPNLHHHSPQAAVNIMPQNSLDSVVGIADDIRPIAPRKINFDIRHISLNGHGTEVNEGAFGYSPNNTRQSIASKSNSYQQHHRSLLMPNSPSFFNNSHANHPGSLSGSPGAPHHMMNMVSPMHQIQVGSAPVLKASLWDRQQIFGESREVFGYQRGALRGVGIPGILTSHHQEIFSPHGSFSRVNGACSEISKNSGLQSSQQRSHMFHERNGMNSLASSFGCARERSRIRRNETQLSHVDRKHFELNIDRILRGEDSRTTLMIKNIPNKYTSKMLLATIDEQHQGTYDFIYLPIDFKNKCNMGYAFINMIDPLQIVAFHQTFEGRKWEKFNSEKVATLAYARIQGKAALIAHFQNSSLMNEDKRCRPILFHTNGPNAGDQEPFPRGTNCRPKPGKLQICGDDEDA